MKLISKRNTNLEVALSLLFAIVVIVFITYPGEPDEDEAERQAEIGRCADYVKLSTSIPSSTDFKFLRDLSSTTLPAGDIVVESTFEAESASGTKSKYSIRCQFTPRGDMEASITGPI
jgi:hypothetical protein